MSGKPEDSYKADVEYINDQIAQAGGIPFEFRQGADIIESTAAMLQTAPDSIVEEPNTQVFLQMYSWRQEMKNLAAAMGIDDENIGAERMKPYVTAYLNSLATVEHNRPEVRQMVAEFRREVS